MLINKIEELTRFAYGLHSRQIELKRLIKDIEDDKEFPLHYRFEIRDVYTNELFTLENNLKNLEDLLPRLYSDMHIIDAFNEADDKEEWRRQNMDIMMNNIEQTNNLNLNSADKADYIKAINSVIYSISRL